MPLEAITVRGPFHGHSGHDHHVREFVRELHNQGIAVQLLDLPEWHPGKLPDDLRDPWFDTLQQDAGARLVLHFCMPHQVARDRGKISVNYTMFEADRVPRSWIRQNRGDGLVIVPSESSRRAWIASGMPAQKLRLCPLGIDPRLFGGKPAPLALTMNDGRSVARFRTRFLNVSELGPRKNIAGLLRAWMKATTAADDAVLILKLSRFALYRNLFPQMVRLVEQDAGKAMEDAAPVHLIESIFPDAEMPRLYAAATHYVSMSFGEGWDQPMLEAGASGLELIAPAHSAYRDYLDSSVATMIPCRAVPAKYWGDPETARLFEGAEWWEPGEDEAAAAIRAAIDGRGEPRQSARERILVDFTWQKAAARLIGILAEVQAAKTKRWFFLRPR